ncbi:MFS transporter [Elizabethkingia anophelis]|uniref:MFS transporter n=1 Tax=Elizabethkingia anophelis R26 TaxID=1246994 RepID=A0ABN5C136_9FLAO|nr:MULTISPECIES: MFS transporter [Elizabethkingia]AQW98486.1 transporter [Elizabethkingia anophelis]AQX89047.1 transporter [Elizabethkingia anophelis]ASV78342.1 MFS transporter [Elizabethkingia anophelis]ATC37557.1 MFS transporter [Elizabethkingia anophelis R26]ATC41236.1 MFS transporter [Elizabethkingia anophelis Ag1]
MKSKRTLYVLALGIFGITTTEFGVIGILPDLAKAFSISIDKAGWLLSAFAIIVAVFGPFMLMLLSSFRRKNLLVFSLLVFAAANIISAYIQNFYLLLLIRMVPAFFHPVYWSVALSVAEKNVLPEEQSKAAGLIFSGLTVATVLGVPLATLISDTVGWQYSFLITALINLIAAAGIQFYLPSIEYYNKTVQISYKRILDNRLLWINLLLSFMLIMAMYSTYGYMSDFLKTVTHMNGKQISFMLLIFGSIGILGNKLAGRYMSRFPVITLALFIVSLSLMHLLIYEYGSLFIPMVWITCFWGLIHSGGFLIGNINVVTSALDAPEFMNSMFTSCGNFAVTAGTLAGGYWIAHYGIQSLAWSSIICLLIAGVLLLLKNKLIKKTEL